MPDDQRRGRPRKADALKDVLLVISVISGARLNGAMLTRPLSEKEKRSYRCNNLPVPRAIPKPRSVRVRINREFASLTEEGHGTLEGYRPARGKWGRVFKENGMAQNHIGKLLGNPS